VDRKLAAMAPQHNVTVLTTDGDFAALRDSRAESWIG
jgi:hypothetical protein